MKRYFVISALVLAASPAWAGPVVGRYVEARTAEVFAGGCIMSSEAETIGRQAVMAWRIDTGTYRGQVLDGLRVVAAVSGDRNLGIREIGGESPSFVRAVVYVDQRADAAQRLALTQLAQALSRGLITEVVQVSPVPISFDDTVESVAIVAGQSQLTVRKSVEHGPACGAMKWFTPFSVVDSPALGTTVAHEFTGRALDARWSAPNRKSAFFGAFTFEAETRTSN